MKSSKESINWNYLAYLCICESKKWLNYSGPTPGSELYARFVGCHRGLSISDIIENDLDLDELLAPSAIYYTAIELQKSISAEEAKYLLSDAMEMRRDPRGSIYGVYTSGEWLPTGQLLEKFNRVVSNPTRV